ncbi:MAG TPA: hypothetical protein VFL07_11345 [Rudaea sp.]|nr:hypothetical protein [Rudaea sp.]
MNLADLTLETVKPMIGTAFEVAHPGGAPLTMTLADALPFEIHARRSARTGSAPRRAPFSLYFLGPPAPVLPQAMYTLRHERFTLEHVFIVPIGADAGAVEYEAVFN